MFECLLTQKTNNVSDEYVATIFTKILQVHSDDISVYEIWQISTNFA